jgi:hypothetical protein
MKPHLLLAAFIVLVSYGVCSAQENKAEDFFKGARFDFSKYKPNPSPDDLYMVYHILSAKDNEPSYHKTVSYVGTILSRSKGCVPGSSGYYLNRSKFQPNAVRITLFAKDDNAAKEIDTWVHGLEENGEIKIIPYVSEKPAQVVFTKMYTGDEKEFRKYLSFYTPISLECMAYNFNESQKIWSDLMTSGGTDVIFLEHSTFFNNLTIEEKHDFVGAMFGRAWMHMVINFVMGYDVERDKTRQS